jgi:AcrR family transcriptional regulator
MGRYHEGMLRYAASRSASPAAPTGVIEESKSPQTRTRILDAAAKVLSVKGYAGLRLTDVAKEADLQAPAIYYYYSSRDQLIEEVMWVGLAQTREHVATVLGALPADATPVDRLLTAVEAHLRQLLDISDYTKAAIRNAGQVPLSIRKRQILEEERYGEIWRRLFNELARTGLLRDDLDPYIAQMLVLGALSWAVEWWDPRRAALNILVDTAKSLVRQALINLPEATDTTANSSRRQRISSSQGGTSSLQAG